MLQGGTNESQRAASRTLPRNCTASLNRPWRPMRLLAPSKCKFISIPRIAVEELKAHRKRPAQGITRIVKRDGFLVLTPVPVPR